MRLRCVAWWAGWLPLAVLLASCGSSGTSSNALTLAYADGTPRSVLPGEVLILTVGGAQPDDVLRATVDDVTALSALNDDGTLSLIVPVVSPGEHTITVRSDRASAALGLDVALYTPIEAPLEYVTTVGSDLDLALQQHEAIETDPELSMLLAKQRVDLAEQLALVAASSPEQQALVAYALRAMQENVGMERMAPAITECPVADQLAKLKPKLVASLQATAIGLFVGAVWAPVGITVAVFGETFALNYLWQARRLIGDVFADCLIPTGLALVGASPATSTTAFVWPKHAGLEFEHGVTQTVGVMTTWDVSLTVSTIIQSIAELAQQYASSLPSSLVAALTMEHGPETNSNVPDDVDLMVGTGNISGTLTKNMSSVSLIHVPRRHSPAPDTRSAGLHARGPVRDCTHLRDATRDAGSALQRLARPLLDRLRRSPDRTDALRWVRVPVPRRIDDLPGRQLSMSAGTGRLQWHVRVDRTRSAQLRHVWERLPRRIRLPRLRLPRPEAALMSSRTAFARSA